VIAMHILRMIADLSFYGAFAGLFAMKAGGSGAIASVLLMSLFYGLGSLGKNRRALRLAWVTPALAGLWLPGINGADRLMLLPCAAYVLWLTWQQDYTLSRERQQQIFSLFCKVLPIFAALAMVMWSAKEVTAVTLPYGLVMMVASVLLMRALRHDPSVYCARRYQLSNLLSVAAIVAGAYIISRKTLMDAAASLLKLFYDHMIWPLLELFLRLLFGLLSALGWLFEYLRSLLKGESMAHEVPPMDLTGLEGLAGESLLPGEAHPLARLVGTLICWAAVALILLVFFRWLKGRNGNPQRGFVPQEEREQMTSIPLENRRKEESAVRGVRRQYRKFLKLLGDMGCVFNAQSTSMDVHCRAEELYGSDSVSADVRKIYIRARYGGEANDEDVQRMKKLYGEARKQKHPASL